MVKVPLVFLSTLLVAGCGGGGGGPASQENADADLIQRIKNGVAAVTAANSSNPE